MGCDKNNNLSLFSPQNDIDLGRQVKQEIESDPNQFPLLSRSQYSDAYDILDGYFNEVLNSGEVAYRDEFPWEITIIGDDEVLNAFATPGGYIYVYTGLIKYLSTADELMGVLGHEVAHSDLRHTSRNLQKQYGVSVLLSLILGEDPSQLQQIAGQIAGTLAGLRFSREFEEEADDKSVVYLAKTPFRCDGAAGFFRLLRDNGDCNSNMEWLSTHPDPCNRVEDIEAMAAEQQCSTTPSNVDSYDDLIAALP